MDYLYGIKRTNKNNDAMKPEQLKNILEKHSLWLKGEGGERANLSRANLYGSDLYGANLYGANLSKSKIPMFCKWGHSIIDGNIKIGCETKTPEQWEDWLSSDQEYETKRGTPDFKQIEAVIRAYIAYLKVLQ
jgi:hypothetical protein